MQLTAPLALAKLPCHCTSCRCPVLVLLLQEKPTYTPARNEQAALRIVELLLAAGYRPTVWRNVAPPTLPQHGSEVLQAFDPFYFTAQG
jgi:hypothetical protein